MSDLKMPSPVRIGETITIVGTQNLVPSNAWAMPTTSICTYTASDEELMQSAPLSDGSIRLVNSMLVAAIPERAILRDPSEDF